MTDIDIPTLLLLISIALFAFPFVLSWTVNYGPLSVGNGEGRQTR